MLWRLSKNIFLHINYDLFQIIFIRCDHRPKIYTLITSYENEISVITLTFFSHTLFLFSCLFTKHYLSLAPDFYLFFCLFSLIYLFCLCWFYFMHIDKCTSLCHYYFTTRLLTAKRKKLIFIIWYLLSNLLSNCCVKFKENPASLQIIKRFYFIFFYNEKRNQHRVSIPMFYFIINFY